MKLPGLGISASSVLAVTGPTPGTEAKEDFLVAPHRGAAHGSVDFPIDLGQLLLERGDQAGDALADPLDRDALLPIALGDDHFDDLTPARDQIGQQLRGLVRQVAHLGLGRLDEAGDHARVDRIGLGPLSDRLGEVTRLRRIDHDDRQRSPCQRGRNDGLETARRLDRDPLRTQRPHAFDELREAFAVARDGKGLALRQNVNVQPVLRHVDPDMAHDHLPSSLRKRALAAQATVRGRWTNGGATRLRHGLERPRMSRHPLRFRASNSTRRRDQ